MQNMGWIKAPLETSDSFIIKSGIVGGQYFIDSISQSIFALPALIPDALSFVSPEITRTSNTVNAKVEWTIYIKFTSNPLTQSGYLSMTLPDNVLFDMGETLTTVLQTNSSMPITNTKTLYTSGGINILKFTSV